MHDAPTTRIANCGVLRGKVVTVHDRTHPDQEVLNLALEVGARVDDLVVVRETVAAVRGAQELVDPTSLFRVL